jgi:hypothetical protein
MSTMSALKSDHFDGAAKITGEQGVKPNLYEMAKELGWRSAKAEKEAADGAAGTATAERPFHRADTYDQRIKSIRYLPAAALTADNTNYATLRVRKRTSTGGDGGIIASVTTQATGSGNWTAFKPVTVTLDDTPDSNLDLKAGESLTFEITKTGTGVIVPAGTLQVQYE